MKLNPTVRSDIEASVLCWLATVDGDGHPSVSPKELWMPHDDETIVVADIASANSVRNVRGNPKVCVSFVDVFRQRGFKLYGEARVVAGSEPAFGQLAQGLLEKAGDRFVVRNVIAVSVTRVGRILAPSYTLYPEIGEEGMMENAFRTYGVRPTD